MILILLFTVFGCRKVEDSPSDNNTSLSDTPMAKAQYDNKNFGIYKGVFVGSSGVVLININNDGQINAKLVINGTTKDFTTTTTVTLGQENTIHFTSGSDFFDFHLRADGLINYTDISNISISGHPNAAIIVLKELSTGVARVYEGDFPGGTFNFVIQGSSLEGAAKNSQNEKIHLFGGVSGNTITNAGFQGNQGSSGTFTGTISNNSVNGSFQESGGNSGNWQGTRSL